MSNTYFEMKLEPNSNKLEIEQNEANQISLTALVGGNKFIQLTIGTYPYGYVLLTPKEANRLAQALLERVNLEITAIGNEQSKHTDKIIEIKKVKNTRIVEGGIYKYPNTEDYALYFRGHLYFLENTMSCLDIDVECTENLNSLELVEGYALACIKNILGYEWQIRDSGQKHSNKYILCKGSASKRFMEQVTELSKSF